MSRTPRLFLPKQTLCLTEKSVGLFFRLILILRAKKNGSEKGQTIRSNSLRTIARTLFLQDALP